MARNKQLRAGSGESGLRIPATELVWRYALMVALLGLFIGPFLWMVSLSFRGTENVYALRLIPEDPTLRNYIDVFRYFPLGRAFTNSVFVALVTVGLNLMLCSLAAYPLARFQFLGKRVVFLLILSTLMIPFQLYMIPLYVMSLKLGLADTLWGIILPGCVGAFGIYLIKQHYQTIPVTLDEAARIDGAGDFAIWWRIMLPLTKPAIAALAIFIFVGTWSDFLWPLIIINSTDKFTLPIAVAKLSGAFIDRSQYIAAGSTLAALPVIIMFFLMQRRFIGGLTLGAVKG